MYLSELEKDMLAGKHGKGISRSMEILIKMGEVMGAKRLIPIDSAHTMPKEPPSLLEEMTEGVDKLGVGMCTHHALMSVYDPDKAIDMGLPMEFVMKEDQERSYREKIYKKLFFYQTNTCMPMLVGNLPFKGQHISWIGAGAQLMANSLLGAKTNRDGAVVNLAAAITGRVPEYGLHLAENRFAEVLVTFEASLDFSTLSDIDFGAIGYFVGDIAQNRNVVFDGFPTDLSLDQLKYLMAPLTTSGSMGVCHIVGLTPEAPSLDEALGYKEPEHHITIGMSEIRQTQELFSSKNVSEFIDMVIVGCPHCSVNEIAVISDSVKERMVKKGKRLWIGMPFQQYVLASKMGLTQSIENAGGFIVSSCMATVPDNPIPDGIKRVATNSFKAAHYIKALSKGKVNTVVLSLYDVIKEVTENKIK